MNAHRLRTLVLMPMLAGFEGVRASVATALAAAGFRMERLEELLDDWEWLAWLHAAIGRCDLILADSTHHNAFVMYELGVARARSLPTLLILAKTDSQISGSLDGSAFRLYADDELADFTDRLSTDLRLIASAGRATPLVEFVDYHAAAVGLMLEFQADIGMKLDAVDPNVFAMRLGQATHHGTFVPTLAATPLGKAGLLAALVRTSRMVDTMGNIRAWVDQRALR